MLKPVAFLSVAIIAACASAKGGAARITKAGPTPKSSVPATAVPSDGSRAAMPQPAVDPAVAHMLGLMPLKNTGVDLFRALHPTYDGRGVLIAIPDSGVDPGVPGLITTSTGAPKVIELRDFSGEGRVPLTAFPAPTEREMKGAGRISRLTT